MYGKVFFSSLLCKNYSLGFYRLLIAALSYFCHIFSWARAACIQSTCIFIPPMNLILWFLCHKFAHRLKSKWDQEIERESENASKKPSFHHIVSHSSLRSESLQSVRFSSSFFSQSFLQLCALAKLRSFNTFIDYTCEWVILSCRWNILAFIMFSFHRRKFSAFTAKM